MFDWLPGKSWYTAAGGSNGYAWAYHVPDYLAYEVHIDSLDQTSLKFRPDFKQLADELESEEKTRG